MDDTSSFLNTETGEVVLISDDEFRAVEEDEDINKFPEWQRKVIELAEKVMEDDSYIKLPSQFDIHEYTIMEKFCLSLADDKLNLTTAKTAPLRSDLRSSGGRAAQL